MELEKVVVSRDNVSPLAAKIVETYFVDRCNDHARPNIMFAGASSAYDERSETMTVDAELKPSASPVVGVEAVERAFKFAEDMLAS